MCGDLEPETLLAFQRLTDLSQRASPVCIHKQQLAGVDDDASRHDVVVVKVAAQQLQPAVLVRQEGHALRGQAARRG